MTVATVVVECLAESGVSYVFGVSNGPWLPYMEAMRTGSTDSILVCNEALVHSLQADGPTVVEAFIDPAEYDRVILRPHTVGH